MLYLNLRACNSVITGEILVVLKSIVGFKMHEIIVLFLSE
jgi:hypothetical protein